MTDEEIPLPPEPDDEEIPPVWVDDDEPPTAPVGESLRERSERIARLVGAARARHIAPPSPAGGFRRLTEDGFDPRGRHVDCTGGGSAGGCRAKVGFPCEHPTKGAIPGFVHPSRLEREREWAGAS